MSIRQGTALNDGGPAGSNVSEAVASQGRWRRRRLPAALLAALVVGGFLLASCTPQEIAVDAITKSFPGDLGGQAVRVATCESSLNAAAVSPGGGNHGLFQINNVHRPWVESLGFSWSQIYDPYVNSAIARLLYDQAGGWSPWSCAWAAHSS